jgi:hypothetical protein
MAFHQSLSHGTEIMNFSLTVRFVILTVVVMNVAIFWDTALCSRASDEHAGVAGQNSLHSNLLHADYLLG